MSYGTETEGGNTVYFHVRKGKDEKGRDKAVLAMKCTADTPGAVAAHRSDGSKVTDKNGQQVYHRHLDYITGRITALEPNELEIKGKTRRFLNVMVHDGHQQMALSLERGDRYWVSFLKKLLNVDLGQDVYLRPWHIVDEKTGKLNQSIGIQQSPATRTGVKVPMSWSSENNYGADETGKGGMPPGEQYEDPADGETKWSFRKRDLWLEDNVLALVRKELEGMQPPAAPSTPVASPPPTGAVPAPVASPQDGADPNEDDLPF